MPRAELELDDVDEIKEGDLLTKQRAMTQKSMTVLETDVTGEMITEIDLEDADNTKRELTAGVRVRDGKNTKEISYQMIRQRGYKIQRKWSELTEEQRDNLS